MIKFINNFATVRRLTGHIRGALSPKVPTSKVISEASLVGAWRLVYSEMRTLDGVVFPHPTYGRHPKGYLIYDASHVMCVYLARGELDESVPEAFVNLRRATAAAYCGRWYLEDSRQAVIHEIDIPTASGPPVGKQRRQAEFKDGALIIRSGIPEGLQDYYLRFERVTQV